MNMVSPELCRQNCTLIIPTVRRQANRKRSGEPVAVSPAARPPPTMGSDRISERTARHALVEPSFQLNSNVGSGGGWGLRHAHRDDKARWRGVSASVGTACWAGMQHKTVRPDIGTS